MKEQRRFCSRTTYNLSSLLEKSKKRTICNLLYALNQQISLCQTNNNDYHTSEEILSTPDEQVKAYLITCLKCEPYKTSTL
jgi:hypothetical protein